MGLDGYRRGQTPPSLVMPHRFGSDSTTIDRLGARLGWQHTSWPGATVTFDAEWLKIEGVVPEVWIERARVTRVRRVGWFSSGVMFDSDDGVYDGVIVWVSKAKGHQLLDGLAAVGWPRAI